MIKGWGCRVLQVFRKECAGDRKSEKHAGISSRNEEGRVDFGEIFVGPERGLSYIDGVRCMMGFALASFRCNAAGCMVALAAIFPVAAMSQTPSPAPQAVPQPPVLQNPISAGDLAFLSGYAGRATKELMKDKQFRALKKAMMPRTEYHYGRDMPLTDAMDDVLDGSPLPVNIRDGRYVTVMGMQGPYLHGRGFLMVRPAGRNWAGWILFHAHERRADADADGVFAATEADFAGAERTCPARS